MEGKNMIEPDWFRDHTNAKSAFGLILLEIMAEK